MLRPGVELRQVNAPSDESSIERLAIVRLDPDQVRFRVHYDPVTPHLVSDWAGLLQPLLLVNGGYFTPENQTACLLVSDGRVWGMPYGDYAGLFAVDAGSRVSVRWLREQPYDPAEPLLQAVMSFPVLVKPGGVMGFPADADEGTRARRTVVAQDFDGRILFIVAPRGFLSLHQMAVFLATSDLGIDVALNLDGGYSTGLWLDADGESLKIDSFVPVPSIISVTLP